MNKYTPTAKSYFSGAGLMDIGLKQAGINIIQSLDLDKNAVNTMRQNSHYFNHKILLQDVKNICVKDQPDSDIMVGTYPCNHYSPIADLFDTRIGDDLYLHFFRHVAIGRPEMYILENVPGMRKFKVVMEAMSKLPGYYINIFCPLDASIWLPQKRARLILIGTKKPFIISAPTKQNCTLKLKDILEINPSIKISKTVYARLNGMYRDMPIIVDPNKNDIAPTCVAHYSKDMGTRLVKDKNFREGVRPFTVREYARLQGVPDDYKFPEKRLSYRLIGNGVPVPMAKWIGKEAIKYFN
jgi:DNA (cytosine-5)-methyltransferase 1